MSIVPQQLSPFDGKVCCCCHQFKPRPLFHNSASRADGMSKRCKACDKAARARCKANETPERIKARQSRMQKWWKANPEKAKAYKDAWYAKDRGKQVSRWAKTHRARVNARKRVRYAADPTPTRLRSYRRKARERTVVGFHTQQEWLGLLARFGGRCLRCGSPSRIQRDHIIALAEDGTNFLWNIQPLCIRCNGWKQDRHINFRPDRQLSAPPWPGPPSDAHN